MDRCQPDAVQAAARAFAKASGHCRCMSWWARAWWDEPLVIACGDGFEIELEEAT